MHKPDCARGARRSVFGSGTGARNPVDDGAPPSGNHHRNRRVHGLASIACVDTRVGALEVMPPVERSGPRR